MKIIKKLTAVLLVLAMCLSFAGCYNEDLTWSAKCGDETAAIGVYLYYLYVAYDNAAALVDSDTEVLKATIDGVSAEEWIRDRANEYMQSYFWVNEKTDEMGLSLTDAESSICMQSTQQMIQYYMSDTVKLGISEDSLNKAYTEYNVKFKKIFNVFYGEGGEFEIDKQVLHDKFVDGKYTFEYIYAPLTSSDAYGNPTEITEEEKANLKEVFENYKTMVENGETFLKNCGEQLQTFYNSSNAPYRIAAQSDLTEGYPIEVTDAIKEMDEKELRIIEADGQLVLMQKDSIEDSFEAAYSVEGERIKMMLSEKAEEFNTYVIDHAKAEVTDLTYNDKAVNSIKLSSLVTDSTKFGTKLATAE